jgi:glutamate synthase (NADPH/NADH) large chain
MTGGIVTVLGQTGRNFAAGMSGGIAYVLDEEGNFAGRCNLAMVELEPVLAEDELECFVKDSGVAVYTDMTRQDGARLRQLIENHWHYTGSSQAAKLLADWEFYRQKFVKVMPMEYRRALAELETHNRAVESVT